MLKRYIAPKDFYMRVAAIAVPLALQSVLSSCMGIVDSMMVSWIGMVSAVGTAAQLETIANMVAYGVIGGCGIFLAQYFGAKDEKNLKRTFGLSLLLSMLVGCVFIVVATVGRDAILRFYLNDPKVVHYGGLYLDIMKFALVPAMLNFAFGSAMRNVGKARVSLYIGAGSMLVNCVANYLLIFGKFGLPEMGVQGAALGTVIAQVFGVTVSFIYAIKTKQPFIGTPAEMWHLDAAFTLRVLRRIMPLFFNELLFGIGSTLFIKAFGALGTGSMDAYYVGEKISQIFFFAVMGIYNSVSIIVGNTLGAGRLEDAKREGNYFIGLSTVMAAVTGVLILTFAAPLVSMFGLKDPTVIHSAQLLVRVYALKIALRLFIIIVFGSLRAGGDTKVLTLLDSGLMWTLGLPLAFISVHVFHIQQIALVFLIVQTEQLVRAVAGMAYYRKGHWLVNLTKPGAQERPVEE